MADRSFGEFFKTLRIKRKLTLREFCQENQYDPGNTSKLERGLLPPPRSREKLNEYAKALGLRKGSDDWYTFFDLAAAEQGRMPIDILEDEELMTKLPVLFRTLRGQKVSKKKLAELIDKIRNT